jgi:predicted DNA-binding transcriptional regulator AlpA
MLKAENVAEGESSEEPVAPLKKRRAYVPAYIGQLGLIEYVRLTKMLGISRNALDRLAGEDGFPPRVRIGRKHWVNEDAVNRWFAMRTGAAVGP